MYIIFIDACPTTMAKSFLPLVNFIKQLDKAFNACFVSLEFASYSNPELENKSLQQILQDSSLRYIEFRNLCNKKIEKFLLEEKPNAVFTNGYRIYDQLWIGISKQLCIPTFHLQQGFEIDSVYFKPYALLSKISKSIRMSYALFGISRITDSNFIILLTQYLGHLFNNKSLKGTALCNKKLHPNRTFVYSEFYKEFWYNKFGIDKESMVLISPIDFLLIPNVRNSIKQNACCYITQTLVEDGRMSKREFTKHLSTYKKIVSHTEKFIIKLHPRANVDIYYNIFRNFPNVEFTREFPNCTVYLTHYSSMAFTAAFFSNTVILHELKGHTTPAIFKRVASHVVSSVDQIIDILDKKDDKRDFSFEDNFSFEDKKKIIEYYAMYDNNNPYKKIYDNLQSEFSRRL